MAIANLSLPKASSPLASTSRHIATVLACMCWAYDKSNFFMRACSWKLKRESQFSCLISPQDILAPALPVTRLQCPFTGGGPGCELSPRPRSSGSACTIIDLPITDVAPFNWMSLSTSCPFATCNECATSSAQHHGRSMSQPASLSYRHVLSKEHCTPSGPATMFPRSPTCRSSSSGPPWFLP